MLHAWAHFLRRSSPARGRRIGLALVSSLALTVPSLAGDTFADLSGRWVGEGRLGIRDNPPETVKCRATYIAGANADELKQTIRCATAGGSIEVISNLVRSGSRLTGHWQETVHNIAGDLEGELTAKGLRIIVKSTDLAANMDVIVKDQQQVVEIQFHNSTLIGLSMLMKKG